MNPIQTIFTQIKDKTGVFYIPLCSFVATTMYAFLSSHISSMFNKGYLSYFKININYPIVSVLSHSKLMLLIFITTLIVAVCMATLLLNHILLKEKIEKIWSWKTTQQLLIFFICMFIILLSVFVFAFSYIYNIDFALLLQGAYDGLSILWQCIKISFYLTIYIELCAFLLFSYSFKIEEKIKDKIENLDSSTKLNNNEKIFAMVAKILYCLVIGFGIFLMDATSLDLGKINASMATSFPSFTENKTDYIVIAKFYNDNYLVIDIDSLQQESIVCIIKNIEGKELTNYPNPSLQ